MRNVCGTVFNRPRESGTFLRGILQSLQKVIIVTVINIIIFESSSLHHHHDQHWPENLGYSYEEPCSPSPNALQNVIIVTVITTDISISLQ